MKKQRKKLRLIKESVRELTPNELSKAAGASAAACDLTTALSCGGSCVEYTCYC